MPSTPDGHQHRLVATWAVLDVARIDAFQAMMTSDAGAAAMNNDGVRPNTLVVLAPAVVKQFRGLQEAVYRDEMASAVSDPIGRAER